MLPCQSLPWRLAWLLTQSCCRAPLQESQQTIPETPSPQQATTRKTQGARSRFTSALPPAPAVCCPMGMQGTALWAA